MGGSLTLSSYAILDDVATGRPGLKGPSATEVYSGLVHMCYWCYCSGYGVGCGFFFSGGLGSPIADSLRCRGVPGTDELGVTRGTHGREDAPWGSVETRALRGIAWLLHREAHGARSRLSVHVISSGGLAPRDASVQGSRMRGSGFASIARWTPDVHERHIYHAAIGARMTMACASLLCYTKSGI